jgi:molybdate transport system substrate-binding protein
MRKRLAAILLGAAAAPLALGAAEPKREILVFAAASLTESLRELGSTFEKQTGVPVTCSFGASSDLARQIAAGAPADVFFSADTVKMDALEKAGLVRHADRREFLSNVLVVAVPKDARVEVRSARDVASLSRIALADPTAVPAGIYAKKWLTGAGVWERIEPRVVPTLDVRSALAAVESGAVPAAIVYRTDASISKAVRVAYEVVDGPEIVYSVAPAARSRRPTEAEAFVGFLAGESGRAVFRAHGFRLLEARR